MRVALLVVSLGISTSLAVAVGTAADPPTLDGFERYVRDDGSFRFSRESATRGLAHLGSWFVPAGDAAGFHHVYTQPEAIEAYRATGAFPDGTALVKEIVAHRRADYTTGSDVASATEPVQWFLMIKDRQARFPDNPLWGDGWAWALFKADAPTQNVATDRRTDCLGCHAPAQPNDWVYVQGYPALHMDRDED
jgi:hypothetical protein